MNKDSVLNKSSNVRDQPLPLPLPRPCTQEELRAAFMFQRKQSDRVHQVIKNYYSNCSACTTFMRLFPLLEWLPKYDYKRNLTSDLASGFTVGVMHIPIGMAYASLSGVHPIVGIYMAIFPIFIYFLMGTSRHISLGSFSVISIITSKTVDRIIYPDSKTSMTDSESELLYHNNSTDKPVIDQTKIYTPIHVATVICITVGIIQVVLGFCKLGSLSMFLSQSLISGFTTGAGYLVVISQLPHVFGIKIKTFSGNFSQLYSIYYVIENISETNFVALGMFLCTTFILVIYSNVIRPKINFKILIPVELILTILSTTISHCLNLNKHYSINIIGNIPIGMVAPSIPPMELILDILPDSLIIAIVSFAINISMATLFARKDNYKIDPNQELVACGFGNIFGGFFSCLPISTSISRSMLQYMAGGKTQIASIFSSLLLLTVILYFGKFLVSLPYCVLAGIVIACLQHILFQIKDLPEFWKQSTTDGLIWLATFLSVMIIDIHYALIIALALSLLSIVLRNQKTHVCLLGRVPNTDFFLDLNKYAAAKPVPNFIIIQINAGLHFANIHFAKSQMESLVNEAIQEDLLNHTLVIDMSGVVFVDPSALNELEIFIEDLNILSINVCFAQCSDRVCAQMKKSNFFNKFFATGLFPTLQDAVSWKYKSIDKGK